MKYNTWPFCVAVERVLALLFVIALSSCGGGDNAPTVAGSNMVPVSIAMQVQSSSLAGPAAAILLPGVKSVKITVTAPDIVTPVFQIVNATPGAAVTITLQVPQGLNRTFTIEAFNGLLGTGAVTFTGSTVVTIAALAVGAPALAINVIVVPTAAADLTAPVITLLGSTPLDVAQGSVYVDAGATALDNVDGDVTANITVVNSVNTSITGTYTVTYDVADATLNNALQVTRTVNVLVAVGTVGTFLYLNDDNSVANTVSAFSINQATGQLTPVAGSPFATGARGTGGFFAANRIAVASGRNLLFVSSAADQSIAVFSINPTTGVLTAVAGSPFAGGGVMGRGGAVEVNQTGDLLFVGNNTSKNISVFSVAANGTLTTVLGSPFTLNHSNGTFTYTGGTDGIRLNDNGSVLYVTGASGAATAPIGAFSVAANGVLTALATSPYQNPGAGSVTSIDLDAISGFAVTGATGGNLGVFSVDGAGNLTPITQTSTGNTGFNALGSGNQQAVSYSPDGSKVILSGGSTRAISVLNVDAAGQLTNAIGSSFAVANTGLGYSVVHPNNQWLYHAQIGNFVEFFNMAADGSLISQQVIAGGAGRARALVIY